MDGLERLGLESLMADRSDVPGTGYVDRSGSAYRRDILTQALRCDEERAEHIVLPRIAGSCEIMAHGDEVHGWGEITLGSGVGDNAVAAFGVDSGPGVAMPSLRTSGAVAAVSEFAVPDPSDLITGFSDASGRWLPLAYTLDASRIIGTTRRVTSLGYEEFNEVALSVSDAGDLRLIPYFKGERTPNLPDATATLEDMMPTNCDPVHVARAAVEGLLAFMHGALGTARAQGVSIKRVATVDSGARSRAVRALASGIPGAKVEVSSPIKYITLRTAKQTAALSVTDPGAGDSDI